MTDAHVRVTRTSWGKRLGGSIKGILVGILLVIGGIALLFWNEGRSVKRAKALTAGAGMVISIDAQRLEPHYDGELVHASGETETYETLRDPLFGVEAQGLLLEREVEMFQWQEHTTRREEKKLGGATETTTTYEYRTTWSDHPIDSSRFEVQEGHVNPSAFPFGREQYWTGLVSMGELELASIFVRGIARKQRHPVREADLAAISDDALRASVRLHGGELYRGENPSSPQVGDMRIRFYSAPAPLASVVGQQRGASLAPHRMPGGQTIALAQLGDVPASEMFEAAQTMNRVQAWLFRGIGFVLLLMGFGAVLKPLSVLADVVPMIGNVVGAGTGFVSFVLSAFTSVVTIAIGWLFYRPFLGVALLLVAGALAFWLIRALRRRRPGATAPAPPSAPPSPPPAPPGPASPGVTPGGNPASPGGG